MTSWILMFGALFLAHQSIIVTGENCMKDEHQKCISLADPLLKDPQLIFPDNMKDIDNVCRAWSNFVDCIRRYTDKCFSKERREQFNSAVEVSIESVHQMCSVSSYQTEYLQHASCIKSTVIDSEHCGNQYAALVNEVSRREVVKPNLCCAHYHFRTCVIMETRKRCDGNEPEGTAAKFSRQILDKALSFLQDQCANYIPNSGNCPVSMMDNSVPLSVSPLGEGSNALSGGQSRSYQRTASPDTYASKTSDFYSAFPNTAYPTAFKSTGRALNPPSGSESRISSSSEIKPSSAQTSSNVVPQMSTEKSVVELKTEKSTERTTTTIVDVNNNVNNNINNEESVAIVVTQRSPNYGRGMSWTTQSTKTSSEIPAWATSTWLASNQAPVTESWFPEAGSFGGNNIDEPNQQGLSKNSERNLKNSLIITVLLISFVFIF
ncbi:uncharacterized protein LOC127282674 [Leptopilina boulardi]|uniref:uncharacterized protein LOC127282674 n=1 Tax=Leptopilina boulardi TaxID=63433 RepID=UPI0021F57413|nr:uncharacterized protein LOC127282674 [Leptopilina boulardi]